MHSPRSPAPAPAQVPAGSHATSGVYRLLSTGQLEPFHADHPYRRQPCSTVSDTLAREEMRGMTLDTAGLKLSSMYCEAHGRWAWLGVVCGVWAWCAAAGPRACLLG